MFDNSKPNCIIFSDLTDVLSLVKTMGPYKVASELRTAGFEVLVVHHLHVFTIDQLKHILKNTISDQTLFVGFNNFFYADMSGIRDHNGGGVELGVMPAGALLPHGKYFNAEIRELIKQTNPKCKLLLGGPTAYDNQDNTIFDYIVVGYAENSIVNLAQHLVDKSVKLEKSYRSIYGPIVVNDSKAEGYDFENCEVNYADHDGILPNETLTLEVARGCIFKCAFCSYPLNGKKKMDFIRSRENIFKELIYNYDKFGITRYIFSDDTFNDSVEKCRMIFEVSQKLPFKLEWWGYLRLDLLKAHPETVDWLFDSGLRSAFFGIETLSPETAKIIGKGGDRDGLFAVVRKIKQKYGNQVNLHGSFIFGLPNETFESIEQTAEFLLSDENPLDSWHARSLIIKPANKNYSNDFLSELDRDFAKFGYENMGEEYLGNTGKGKYSERFANPSGTMLWKNQHTNFLTVDALSKKVRTIELQKNRAKVTGTSSFGYAGADITLDDTLNVLDNSVDWHNLDKIKLKRAVEYKEKMFKNLPIPQIPLNEPDVITFSEWLRKHAVIK